jgi:hypothetical protein
LRETSLGAEHLPADVAAGPLRQAADKLAKAASASRWTAQKTRSLFDHLTQLAKDLRTSPAPQQFGRADLLALALQGVVTGIEPKQSPETKDAVSAMRTATRSAPTFNADTFVAAVEKLAATLPKLTATAP